MHRLRISLGLLAALSWGGLARAQTSGSDAAPPPAPGRVESPALERPATDLRPITEQPTERPGQRVDEMDTPAARHDALQAGPTPRRGDLARAPKEPPAPITERPSGARTDPRAIWVPGYWDWDSARGEFVWMGGVWQVPPTSSIWVASRWMRDRDGWYRRPGFWSRRRDGVVATSAVEPNDRQPAWRTTGPPADHPPDVVADAPGPDYFLVPGHYAPEGDQLRWKPSFWTRIQAGWDWIPARWVRRASGWEFRAGHWVREPEGVDVRVTIGGRTTARVVTPGRGDIVAEPSPANRDGAIDEPPPPPGSEDERDPIAEAETAGRVRVIVPGIGMPYYVIRPPGSYPYGPGGVVVPGAVPPFVRRILDRVLP